MKLEPGVDVHTDDGKCIRCLMDVGLYDEAYWDLDTNVHLNPNEIAWNEDGTYEIVRPLTIYDIVDMAAVAC